MGFTATIKPNSVYSIDQFWRDHNGNDYGGFNAHNWLSDNNGGTYLYAVCCSARVVELDYGSYSLAANQRCSGIRHANYAESFSSGFSVNHDIWIRTGTYGDVCGVNYSGALGPAWRYSGWHSGDYSQGIIDGLRALCRDNMTGVTTTRLGELWIELDIQTQSTVSVTAPSGTGVSRNPTVNWNANFQGMSAKSYQVHIRRNSDSALMYDSGVLAGNPGSHFVTTTLASGTSYSAIVRVSTDWFGGDWWSDWSAWQSFTTVNLGPSASNVIVPAQQREDMSVTWSYSDPEADAQNGYQVKIFDIDVVNAGGFDANTSSADFDSGIVASASASVSLNTDLSPGRYYAYVRVRDAGANVWSAWTPSNEFRIINSPLMNV